MSWGMHVLLESGKRKEEREDGSHVLGDQVLLSSVHSIQNFRWIAGHSCDSQQGGSTESSSSNDASAGTQDLSGHVTDFIECQRQRWSSLDTTHQLGIAPNSIGPANVFQQTQRVTLSSTGLESNPQEPTDQCSKDRTVDVIHLIGLVFEENLLNIEGDGFTQFVIAMRNDEKVRGRFSQRRRGDTRVEGLDVARHDRSGLVHEVFEFGS